MGDQTEYVELLSLVVDFHDHTVAVSSDSEDDTVAGHCAGRRVVFGDLRGHLPLCAFCFAEPGLQCAAGVGMFLPEFVKSALEQDAQGRTDVPLYIIRINVPNMDDCMTLSIGGQDIEVYFGDGAGIVPEQPWSLRCSRSRLAAGQGTHKGCPYGWIR